MAIKTDKIIDSKTNKILEVSNLVTFKDGKLLSVNGEVKNVVDVNVDLGDFPIIFGVLSHYSCGGNYNHSTSDLNTADKTHIEKILLGWGDWKLPRQIVYPNAVTNSFVYKDKRAHYACSSNQYNYTDKMVSILFIKNPDNITKSFTFYFGGSSEGNNSSHNGSRLWQVVPSGGVLNYSLLHNYTSNTSNYSANVNISVPANTTIALVYVNSEDYSYGNNNHYSFNALHKLYNLHNIRNAGLLIDKKAVLKAFNYNTSAIQIFN